MIDRNFLQSDIEEIVARTADLHEDLSGKHILLTGGNGFLGRYFRAVFQYLNANILSKKMHVVLLDNFTTSSAAVFNSEDEMIECIPHDVIKPFRYKGKLDYIVHAAGIASPYYYRAKPLLTLDVAVLGCRHLLELAKKKRANFTFFSSSEIYGDPDPRHVPMPESYRGEVSITGPRACYDESKRLGETLCYIYHHEFGVHTNMIRPFNVYGPGMQETDYRVLPNFASRIFNDQPLQLYGDGKQTRTYCYITDAIVGFLRVIVKGIAGEPYNIGNDHPEVSLLELVSNIEAVCDKKLQYNIIEHPDSYPADEPKRRCPDIKKAKYHLGFNARVDLQDGLNRFLNWAEISYSREKLLYEA